MSYRSHSRVIRTGGDDGSVAAANSYEAVRSCSLCFPDSDNAPVADGPKPPGDVMAMLVGQAPGITEVTTRRPFTGPAGKRLDVWLQRAGVSRDELHFAAVARCFPGKARGGGDKVPSRAMIGNCRAHLDRDFEVYRPEVVILIGGLAIKEVLGIKTLSEAAGRIIERDGVRYVPLPHPSGASTWLNRAENKARLDSSLRSLKELMDSLRTSRGDGVTS
ncbi:uracil-DNA glycosylase family protein [Rubrobacter indicoceani]|uniref:uracil-DNA glycosylase family protein n=1 Tax=Rubrobacter indicoceani TaxID=2051957 RepID=UPI000E5B8790|nr:uracil-DNA glycosylase family protein [Rubrobacter indicoceani]